MQGERELRRSRYAVPLGLLSFAALVYLGFIREEGTSGSNTTQSTGHDSISLDTSPAEDQSQR